MATANTGAFSALLAPGLRKVFFDELKNWPEEYTKLLNVETTSRAYEDEQTVVGLGLMQRKAEGTPITYDSGLIGYSQRYTPVSFSLGFSVTKELYDDEMYGVIKKMSKQLARSAALTVEYEVGQFVDDLFAGATYTTADNLAVCNTAHTLEIGGTYANCPATHVDLSISAIRAAAQRMENMVDGRGLKVMCRPSTIVVSPTYQWVAHEIIKSEKVPYSAENQPNSTQDILNLSYMVYHYGSDEDMWFMLAPKGQHDLRFFWRQKPQFDNSDDFNTKDARFSVMSRFTMGATDWRGIDGSSGG